MTPVEIAEYLGGLYVLREQIWHGHLTISGLQHAWRVLDRDRSVWSPSGRPAAEWLLDLLEAELLARELDASEAAQ